MPTRIETIYNKMKQEIIEIKGIQIYDNESVAFGHFVIKAMFNEDDQKVKESMTDGFHDNGIDAVFVDTRSNPIVHFFQFKFPNSVNTIQNGYTDAEVKGLGMGVQEFLTSGTLNKGTWNKDLQDMHLVVRGLDSYSAKLWVVRFTNAEKENQFELLGTIVKNIENLTLNKCAFEFLGAKELCELFENKYEKKYPTIKIKLDLGNEHQSYQTETFRSITTVCYLKNLYDAVSDVRDTIFEGNVRYYNPKTEVTQAIRETLTTNPENFILYNNGVTILTESANFNSPNKTFTLNSASIINGAQTVGSILDVLDSMQDKSKFEKSPILLRILEIKDTTGWINNIVYSLNTQTKMFTAYSISNDLRLKELQKEINEHTVYFLEIKYNEFESMRHKPDFNKLKKNKLDSEKMIQCFVSYYDIDNKAYLAKLAKSDLLKDDEFVNKLLDKITIEKFKNSFDCYQKILRIISQFRSYKNSGNDDILKLLSIKEEEVNNYHFLTTGDILTLFATGHCLIANSSLTMDQAIEKAIHIISKSIKNLPGKNMNALSNITKSKTTFERIRKSVYRSLKTN